ncbi:ERAD-associated protein [Ceratobasidium sp. 395]|nr:ERAD-associated protein [Ceratobasidium sp. 395]
MHLNKRRRRAVLLCTILATCSAVVATTNAETSLSEVAQESTRTLESVQTPSVRRPEPEVETEPEPTPEAEKDSDAVEAQKALTEALSILKALDALPPTTASPTDPTLPPWLTSLFPTNPTGPLASTLRIATKLRTQSWLPTFLSTRASRDEARVRQRAARLVGWLEKAVKMGNVEAMYVFAHISMYPPVGLGVDTRRAYRLYERHAQLTGNGTSQGMLGFFHATGYDGVVPVDQAKASLYYTFGASSGDAASQMAMGYRYWAGIGVAEDCMAALEWYERASNQAMTHFLSGPHGGRTLPLKPTKLSDLAGGLYGHGASVASTGYNALRAPITAANARAAGETWADVLEYYTYHADRHEPDMAIKLAKIYYHGSIYAGEAVGKVQRDYWRASKYFRAVARRVWVRDNIANPLTGKKELSKDEVGVGTHVAAACAYLGKMYLRGEGVKPDVRVARMWFMRGAEAGEKESHNGLGIIYRDGLFDGKPDLKKAASHFSVAAGQDLAEAQVNLGKLYYGPSLPCFLKVQILNDSTERRDFTSAIPFFETAIRHGAPFEAYYYLASYNAQRARAREPSCSVAVAFHKLIAERGSWALNEGSLVLPNENGMWRQLKEDGELGLGTGGSGRRSVGEERMVRWSVESERGDEVAQNNLAFILDQDRSLIRSSKIDTNTTTARVALQHYTRSAAQRNVDALVKVADYHYHGLGTAKDVARAVGYYSAAVDTQMSALAMWNLGWCYENGVGVPKDYHLAKRHYDMALATNSEAYYPATLSLIQLYLKSMYYTITGGTDKTLLLLDPEGIDGEDAWDLTKRLAGKSSASNDKTKDKDSTTGGTGRSEGGTPQEEDPIKWGRQRGQEIERERGEADMDYLPEDFFDGMTARQRPRGGEDDDEDDEFLETVFLVVLCAAISGLIYLRGRWVAQRAEEQRGQDGQDGQGQGGQDQVANAMFPLGENFGVDR